LRAEGRPKAKTGMFRKLQSGYTCIHCHRLSQIMTPPLSPQQLERALDLQHQGLTQERIARELGVCRETISRRLKAINLQAADALHEDIVDERTRQVECLRRLQMEAVLAWGRSQKDAETYERTVEIRDPGEEPQAQYRGQATNEPRGKQTITRERTTVQRRDAKPAFLAAALGCMAAIRKLYGLERGSKPGDMLPIIHGIVAVFLKYIPEELHAKILDALNRDMGPAFGKFVAPGGAPVPRPSDLALADPVSCPASAGFPETVPLHDSHEEPGRGGTGV
jgi:transcriptional regulator with XRE-family HTH domain